MARLVKPKLERFEALNGENAIGYRRQDGVPIVHVIMQCPPGHAFQVGPHFAECPICRDHDIAEEDFAAFLAPAGRRVHGAEAAGAGNLGVVEDGELLGPCPSCRAAVSIGRTVNPKSGKMESMLMHKMPFCSYFGDTDPDVVVRDMKTP